jgi:membrane fusion protein, multidrug efflux system
MTKRSWIIPAVVLIAAIALLLVISGHWISWESSRTEQTTDDAYVRADVTPLSTRISGTVRKVNVNDYQQVQAGQVLMELDDNDYRAILDEAKAALAASEAALRDNQAAKRIADAQIKAAEAVVTQANAAIEAANAGVAAVKPELLRSNLERRRQEALYQSQAATHQQLESITATDDQLTASLKSREADLAKAEGALASSRSQVEAAKQQRLALDTKDDVYKADIQAKQASIVVAEVNLGYTKILAPTDGSVGERHVLEGQLVAPGTQMIDLVKGDVWIQANFKETQLGHIRKGDVADVRIDTFPGVVLHGKVAEISPASGSQFALLPPDNATGNFTKVVQRIPVKIVLDSGHPLQGQLRPGFSAVVTVHAGSANSSAQGGSR